ncbi:StfH/YfcO family fimbrial adhesin, partial [Salmonella enterica subsp. enterica serovar Infantis]
FTLEITVHSDDYVCPCLASSHIVATTILTNETYSPPDTRSSVCPKDPVDTFDISWYANVSKQKTPRMHDATGGTVN